MQSQLEKLDHLNLVLGWDDLPIERQIQFALSTSFHRIFREMIFGTDLDSHQVPQFNTAKILFMAFLNPRERSRIGRDGVMWLQIYGEMVCLS